MMQAPRSALIYLILLCGIARWICAQAAPALTAGGVFYLKERVAVTTKVGIMGLAPGTGVRLISEMEIRFALPTEQQLSMCRGRS
jgi:hypothetical protein